MTSSVALVLLVALGIAGSLASRILFHERVNAVGIFFSVWIPVVLIEAAPFMGLRPLLPATWVALLIGAASFVAGSLYVGVLVAGRSQGMIRRPRPLADDADDEKLIRWFKVGVIALAAWAALELVTALPAFRAAGGIGAIFSNGIGVTHSLRATRIVTSTTGFTGGSLLRSLLGYGLFLGTVTLFWAPRVARRGRWLLASAPLLIMAFYSFVTLARFSFLYSVILSAFAYLYDGGPPSQLDRLRSRGARKIIVLLAILVPLMIYAPLKLREPTLTPASATRSVAVYFAGGTAGLNEQIRTSGYGALTDATRGTSTLWGAASIASRFGLSITLPQKDKPFVDVGHSSPTPLNVYTYLVYFLDDFGGIGLVVCPFIFGLAATGLHYQVRANGRAELIPAAAILMTSVVMSFFGLSLIRDVRYVFVAVAAPMLGRLVVERRSVRIDASATGGRRA